MTPATRTRTMTLTDLTDAHRTVLQAVRIAVRVGNGHEVAPDCRPAGPAAEAPFDHLTERICRTGWRPPGIDPPTAPRVSADEHLLLRAFGHAQVGKVEVAGILLAAWMEPADAISAARAAAAALAPLAGAGLRLGDGERRAGPAEAG